MLRFLARQLVGGDALKDASWEKAELHLRTAAELAPDALVHHLELGLAYLDVRREDEARAALQAAALAVPRNPADRRYIDRAAAILARPPDSRAPL